MITRNVLRAAALVAAIAVGAPAARAQSPIKLGIAGGLTLPMSDTKEAVENGYNGTVTLAFNAPLIPVGLRVDGMFNELKGKELGNLPNLPNLSVSSVNANLTFNLIPLPVVRVYAIGGVGYYRTEFKDFSDPRNDIGFNAGLGVRLGFLGPQVFAEGRYHRVNTGNDTHIDIVPVTIGVMF